jgi:hypothetical protein
MASGRSFTPQNPNAVERLPFSGVGTGSQDNAPAREAPPSGAWIRVSRRSTLRIIGNPRRWFSHLGFLVAWWFTLHFCLTMILRFFDFPLLQSLLPQPV